MKTLVCAISFAATAVGAAAGDPTAEAEQAGQRPEWKMPSTESFVLRSTASQHEYQVMVALPGRYAESGALHPVLYVLDGNGMFPLAVETARFLDFDELKQQPVIVGIGYPVGVHRKTLGLRLRDFTPTADEKKTEEISRRFAFATHGSGGAAAFLRFLTEELMPEVERRYRIDPRRRALHGYSLGGLFATYVLFMQPELFESYLIGAPGRWNDPELGLKLEMAYFTGHSALPARVFLSVGLLDKGHVAMIEELDRVLRKRNYRGLVWRTEFFENETHNSVIPLTLSRGIRWLYGDADASR